MGFFKKIKGKIKIGMGHVAMVVLGGVGVGAFAYWSLEVRGYEINIFEYDEPFDRVVFIGDTGEGSDVRERIIQDFVSKSPNHVFLLGDLCYPVGCTDQEEFEIHIRPFLNPTWKTHCITGNHDSFSLKKKERDWLAKNADDNGCNFHNYYRMLIFNNACVAIMDSTVYVAGKEPDIVGRQERFIRSGLSDDRCKDKDHYLLAHHNRLGFGGHIDDVNRSFQVFIDSLGPIIMVHGHEHIIAHYLYRPKKDEVSWFYTFGSGSKKEDHCELLPSEGYCYAKHGYGMLNGGLITPVFVE